MKRVALGLLGAVALSMGSVGHAAVTVGPTSLDVSGVTTVGNSTTIGFSDGTLASPDFTEFLTFTNTIAGFYDVAVTTSAAAVNFTSIILNGPGGSSNALVKTFDNGSSENFNLAAPITLAAGTYTLNLVGKNSGAGSLGGSVTIGAVPEPGTWALMLLGFGGMGIAMRRNRKRIVAQLV